MYTISTHIADDSQVCQHAQDLEPDADVLCSLRHNAPGFTHKLLCVQSDLHPVVEQRKQWSQWEGSHKDGDEAELENWKGGELYITCDVPLTRATIGTLTSGFYSNCSPVIPVTKNTPIKKYFLLKTCCFSVAHSS